MRTIQILAGAALGLGILASEETPPPAREEAPPAPPAEAAADKAEPAGKAEKAAGEHEKKMTPEAALRLLVEGNARYAAAHCQHPGESPDRRLKIALGQTPFAVVLGCSDSRVPPEVIFDQGPGDLFVIRVAGNIVEPATLASIEYAVAHLKAPLVVVLGHERCGAVFAAASGGEPEGHLAALLDPIRPAVSAARGQGGDILENAVRAHTLNQVAALRASRPILAAAIEEGRTKVVAARYDLETGTVEFFK